MESEHDIKDRQIIREVRQGQIEGFAGLVDRYKGPVFNLAFRMTGSRQDAEDLAQETFLKAFLGLKRFDPERRFFPWLFAIAVNTVRNHLKKKPAVDLTRSPAGAQHLPSGRDSSPEKQLADKQKRLQMADAVGRLPLEQREAVILRYYQDLPFDDVAAVCAVPLSTAKMRVYRGLQRLAIMLDETVQPDESKNSPKP